MMELVSRTPFESLAARIKADNEIRDHQIECLEKIIIAYSYIMCVLESSPRPITAKDIITVNEFIDKVTKEKNKKAKNKNSEYWIEDYSLGVYIWANYCYIKDSDGERRRSVYDRLINKSSYWQDWKEQNPEAKKDLTFYRLQEDLWDQGKGEIRCDRLVDFVKNYPWAFPPNVFELHKEMVALDSTEAPA